MTQKEFFERTKLTVSEQEYKAIELMYCECGNMDKDQFCADYKKHHDSQILQTFYNQSNNLKDKVSDLTDKLSDLEIFLVNQAEKWSASDLREKAIQLMGVEKYLKAKIQRGYNLWDVDRQDLIQILGNR